jgi:hypothetical protein
VRGDHQHRPVHHLRVLLQEAVRLRGQAVVKARVAVHLHLQQHHRKLRAACFGAAGAFPGPQHAIEAVVQLFKFWSLKAIEAIAGIIGIQTQAGGTAAPIQQQSTNQVGCALKNAVIPAVGVQTVLGAG